MGAALLEKKSDQEHVPLDLPSRVYKLFQLLDLLPNNGLEYFLKINSKERYVCLFARFRITRKAQYVGLFQKDKGQLNVALCQNPTTRSRWVSKRK
jgi:hypothetical protein